MSTTPTHLQAGEDEPARSDSPIDSKYAPVIALVPDLPTEKNNSEEISNPELIQYSAAADHLLSIPAPAVNDSRSSFAPSDSTDHSNVFDPLSPEITSADITVAREYKELSRSGQFADEHATSRWQFCRNLFWTRCSRTQETLGSGNRGR